MTGTTVHEAVQKEIVEPLDLDGMFIATPPDHQHRLADAWSCRSATRSGLNASRRGMERIAWLRPAVEAFMVVNFDRLVLGDRIHESELPALNGCFTARSLARMYAALAGGGELDGRRFLRSRRSGARPRCRRPPATWSSAFPMRWRLGYHMAATTRGVLPYGFGHFGFGGSGAWADPDRNLSVAMVCNRVAGTPFADTRMLRIGAAAVRGADRR